jgi:hypothetical protein
LVHIDAFGLGGGGLLDNARADGRPCAPTTATVDPELPCLVGPPWHRGRRSRSSPGPTVLLAGYDGGRGEGARAAEGRGPGGAEADDAKQLRDDDDGIPSLLRAAAVEEEDLISLVVGSSSHGECGQGLDERR